MKKIISGLILMALVGCAHHQPASLNSGASSDVHVQGCSNYVFGIPLSAEETRIDNVMFENDIDIKDVYSVQHKETQFFFTLFTKECTIVTLNNSNKTKVKKISALQKAMKVKAEKEEQIDNTKYLEELSKCNKFRSTKKSLCKEKLRKKYKR